MKKVHILNTLEDINLVSDSTRLKTHYHLRLFEENGIIEFVYTELINGITQKYYN